MKSALEAFKLPPWLVSGCVLASYSWPYLRDAWLRYRQHGMLLSEYRESLEVLKLRCEIEAIRRANRFQEGEFPIPEPPEPRAARPAKELAPPGKTQRFATGAAGASALFCALQLAGFLSRQFDGNNLAIGAIHGWVAVNFLCIITTLLAAFTAMAFRGRSRRFCFGVGIIAPFILVIPGVFITSELIMFIGRQFDPSWLYPE